MIRQITVLPVKEASNQTNLAGDGQSVLLAMGLLNLGEYGNLSSAFYDGSQWIPYLVAAAEDGSIDGLASIFFKSYHVNLTRTSMSRHGKLKLLPTDDNNIS